MAANSLHYGDFRPIKSGDDGYTDDLRKKRYYYSPSTNEIITLRQFQKNARKATYTQYVRQRQSQGIAQKKYKPRVSKPKHEKSKKPKQEKVKKAKQEKVKKPKREKAEKPKSITEPIGEVQQRPRPIAPKGNDIEAYRQRRDDLKSSYAFHISGGAREWEELTDKEKSDFWNAYDSGVKGNYIDNTPDYYADFFGIDEEYFQDMPYGETP